MTLRKGRIAKTKEVLSVRAIQREDLPRLLKPRDKTGTLPAKLRESHHTVARFLATGSDHQTISALTGYSLNRIGQLAQSPAMQELIALYRSKLDQTWLDSVDAFYDLATRNMIKAERMLADKLEEAEETGETLPTRDLIAISRDAADRFGYGKRSTQTNVNVDFAAELERRIARRENRDPKIVDLKLNPTSGPLRRFG